MAPNRPRRGPQGRKPLTSEERELVHGRVPASTFEEMESVITSLSASRSDFIAYAVVKATNEFRVKQGKEPKPIPAYLVKALKLSPDEAGDASFSEDDAPCLQEALLAS